MEEQCELAIIGAGYAAISAFNAAAKYLPLGSTVVIVDRGTKWGGQFTTQYDYVRLHQPYQQFTAGEREWAIAKVKPPTYLATKMEILSHFDDIANACIEEKNLNVIYLWNYQYNRDYKINSDGKVEFVVHHVQPVDEDDKNKNNNYENIKILPVRVVADRMINGSGFDVQRKQRFQFEKHIRSRIHSLRPADVQTAKFNSLMKYSKDFDKPIYIIGSGKTAMDTMLALKRLGNKVASRIRCIAGRGTYFINRDRNDNNKWFLEMMDRFDGTNSIQIAKEMEQVGFLHTAIPDARSCNLGVCSSWEVESIRETLHSAPNKIIKGYLKDIVVSHNNKLCLKLLALNTHMETQKEIEDGTFIVNCTDNLGFNNPTVFDPIVSNDGKVLSPQGALGFSGQSADLLTHCWYQEIESFDSVWRNIPRLEPRIGDKLGTTIGAMYLVAVITQAVAGILPKEQIAKNKQINSSTPQEPVPREISSKIPKIVAKFQEMFKGRYDDDVAFHDDFEFMDEVKKIRTKLETLPAISRL